MQEKKVIEIIKQFYDRLPKFSDGRIDYSDSDVAPVITVFVKVGEEFLLLKRSDRVRAYQKKWNVIAGYLDEVRPIEDKVFEEIKEEAGIDESMVTKISVKDMYEFKDKGKTWITWPVLVELARKPEINLDWEHSEYRWVKKEDLSMFDTVSDLDNGLKRVV